jgi:hypothetical protein
MSKYTTQVRWIIEQATYENQDLSISQRVALACSKIFNFDFPIWDEEYRATLEKKILMHYFNKEIGFETVGLWKFYLEERLNLIMPYYNNLYKTTVRDYDWLTDTNSHETYIGNKKLQENAKYDANGNVKDSGDEKFSGTDSNELKVTQNQNSKTLSSDLPQANYADIDYGTELKEEEQNNTNNENATAKNNSTTNRSSTTDTTQNSTNDLQSNTDDIYTRDRVGAFGSRSLTELLMQYRESLINIDAMVINELADLFMTIY